MKAALALLLLAVHASAQTPEARSVRNVLVILIDDLGVMDVGAYNPETFYETPAMDGLAASGMRFRAGYAASPVCSPTRYSLMTGKHPARGKATEYFSGRRVERFQGADYRNRMLLSEVTLAEALRARGLRTFFAGKWHLGPSEEFWPENQGFEVNRGGFSRGGPYGGKKYFSPYGNPRLTDGPEGEHLPDRLASETIAFMQDRSAAGEPFLAYLSFYSVHTPLMGPAELVAKYEDKAREQNRAPDPEADFAREDQHHNNDRERRVRTKQNHAVYASMVESTDRAIGRVLDALEDLGLDESTAVFLTSDNGGLSTSEGSPTSNLPYRAGKGWLYEGGIREAFLARVPGLTQPGTICDVPVQSTDLFPTVLDVLGFEPEPVKELEGERVGPVDGASFADLLEAPKRAPERALFWHYPHYSNQGGFPGAAIRQGSWKLLEHHEDGRVELYDLSSDPGERTDLAKSQPERVEELRSRLHAWYAEVDAQFLRPRQDVPDIRPWHPKRPEEGTSR